MQKRLNSWKDDFWRKLGHLPSASSCRHRKLVAVAVARDVTKDAEQKKYIFACVKNIKNIIPPDSWIVTHVLLANPPLFLPPFWAQLKVRKCRGEKGGGVIEIIGCHSPGFIFIYYYIYIYYYFSHDFTLFSLNVDWRREMNEPITIHTVLPRRKSSSWGFGSDHEDCRDRTETLFYCFLFWSKETLNVCDEWMISCLCFCYLQQPKHSTGML